MVYRIMHVGGKKKRKGNELYTFLGSSCPQKFIIHWERMQRSRVTHINEC